MKKNRVIYILLSLLLLILIINFCKIVNKQQMLSISKNTAKVRRDSHIEEDENTEKTTEKMIQEVKINGVLVEITDAEIISDVEGLSLTSSDFCVGHVIDQNGTIIPDSVTKTNELLVVEMQLEGINPYPFSGCDYILLNFSFQCNHLIENGIGSLPMVLLSPHGEKDAEGKDYNRLYIGNESKVNNSLLYIEDKQTNLLKVGFLVRKEWMESTEEPCILLFTEFGKKSISLNWSEFD